MLATCSPGTMNDKSDKEYQRYGEVEKRMKSLSIEDDYKVRGRSGGRDFDFLLDDEEETYSDFSRKYNIKYLHHEYRQHHKDHNSITILI